MKNQILTAALLIASALIMSSCGKTGTVSEDIPKPTEDSAVKETEESMVTKGEKTLLRRRKNKC